MDLFKIFISAALVDNIILARYIGLCPYIGMSSNVANSLGMGMAVTFVMVLASIATWALWNFIFVPLGLEYLQIMVFILVIAVLVQLLEAILKKTVPNLYQAMGIYLPLITTNCAILAVTFFGVDYNYNLLQVVVYSIGVALGFTIALLLLAGIREKLRFSKVPQFYQGYPIVFISTCLLAIAFMGFKGLVK
ncbi:MAG TPA: RnfABCDGE type electron transport complex subunit A [Candidatus Atribacteria bacterium]|uniref:electron transport complex protein RnfA n=1 Tax=Candidatus Sordicultor fermentans TaxID=1953203 RepID=UPI001697B555|nr:RnfABCDGE type electron transport complex subunit A [Atribacterota bacterium]NLY06402.1 RnfABCDGE type electron transport complex subunit A [Candidatus Atribacteria bacterium]MDI9608003.1 RnfABCDGE type electron transport complex subunit A [Atribacterota bacterium]MDY0135517.1 RnfABCDGE type electron transport complex subunit A [Atribacterota bacterium]HOA98661.1 RnfABCDGE type electron transport complex subunit A [Candidatus Atribacteria bacterium]